MRRPDPHLPDDALTERILRLRTMPILTGLSSTDLAALAVTLIPRNFQRDELVLVEDLPPRSMYLIRTGKVTMRRRGKRIGTVRGPGGVGFISMLARTAGGTSAVADSFVEAYELRADVLEEIFEDHYVTLLRTIRFIAQRLVAEMKDAMPPPYVPPPVAFDHLIGDSEIGVVEHIFLLRRARAFAQANVNSLATLAKHMEEMRVPAGTTLWKPGQLANDSYFIVKGMSRLVSHNGERVQIVGPGYTIGGAEALIGSRRWNTFTTDEPSVFLRGEHLALIDLFEDDYDLALRFLSMLATYLLTLQDRKAEAGITSVGTGPQDSEPLLPAATQP